MYERYNKYKKDQDNEQYTHSCCSKCGNVSRETKHGNLCFDCFSKVDGDKVAWSSLWPIELMRTREGKMYILAYKKYVLEPQFYGRKANLFAMKRCEADLLKAVYDLLYNQTKNVKYDMASTNIQNCIDISNRKAAEEIM